MIGMTENGPIPEWSNCFKKGVKWGLFMGWSDLVFSQNEQKHLYEIYNTNSLVLTVENRDKVFAKNLQVEDS